MVGAASEPFGPGGSRPVGGSPRGLRPLNILLESAVLAIYGSVGAASVTLAVIGLLWGQVFGWAMSAYLSIAALGALGVLLLGAAAGSYRYGFRPVQEGRHSDARTAIAVLAIGNLAGGVGAAGLGAELAALVAFPLGGAYLLLGWMNERSATTAGR